MGVKFEFYRVVIAGIYRRDTKIEVYVCHLPALAWGGREHLNGEGEREGCFWALSYERPDKLALLCQLFHALNVDCADWDSIEQGWDESVVSVEGKAVGVIIESTKGRSKLFGHFPVSDIPIVPLPELDWAGEKQMLV